MEKGQEAFGVSGVGTGEVWSGWGGGRSVQSGWKEDRRSSKCREV